MTSKGKFSKQKVRWMLNRTQKINKFLNRRWTISMVPLQERYFSVIILSKSTKPFKLFQFDSCNGAISYRRWSLLLVFEISKSTLSQWPSHKNISNERSKWRNNWWACLCMLGLCANCMLYVDLQTIARMWSDFQTNYILRCHLQNIERLDTSNATFKRWSWSDYYVWKPFLRKKATSGTL